MKQIFIFIFNLAFALTVYGQGKPTEIKLTKTIPLPGVHGKFDHMAVDSKNNRLYLAAKGNNSVEVVDLEKNKIVHSIKNISAPQGILFIPEENIIVVSSGGDGTLKGFDATDFKEKFILHLGGEADNIRFSSIRHRIYVAYGDGAIAVIDSHSFKKVSEITFTAHPEAFSLDSSNEKMWVNLPDMGLIKLINLDTEKEIASWETAAQPDNFPMSLVDRCHKLIVASRLNPEISILNCLTGEQLQSFKCDSDPDAMFYDERHDRVFISCGGGSIYILNNIMEEKVKTPVIVYTRKGARTCKWISETNSLFVALPEIDGKMAEIRLYQ